MRRRECDPMSVVCPRRGFVTFECVFGCPIGRTMEEEIDHHHLCVSGTHTPDPMMALENSGYVLRSRVIGRESQSLYHAGDENGATHQGESPTPEQ